MGENVGIGIVGFFEAFIGEPEDIELLSRIDEIKDVRELMQLFV